jgi:hypothetical protein
VAPHSSICHASPSCKVRSSSYRLHTCENDQLGTLSTFLSIPYYVLLILDSNTPGVDILILLVLDLAAEGSSSLIVQVMATWHGDIPVHLCLVDFLGVDDTLDIVVGVTDGPEDVSTEREGDDQHQPGDQMFGEVSGLESARVVEVRGRKWSIP